MTDTPTLPPTTTTPAAAEGGDARRTIRPRRSLPGGRAVIGAFLVVVAAVGTFGAYLSATAAPDTTYMVATRAFQIGDVIEESDLVGADAAFRAVPIDLPDAQAERAITSSAAEAGGLLGQVVVAPIAAGDLLQRTHFVTTDGATDGVSMSFSLPVDRALAGRVGAGERIDIIATFATAGRTSETRLVARGVTVISATDGGDGLNGGRVTLTVELPDLATAQQLQHAVDTAQVALLRGGDADAPTPDAVAGDAPPDGGPASGTDQPAQGQPAQGQATQGQTTQGQATEDQSAPQEQG